MAPLIPLFTFGFATYLVLILAFLGYCLVMDRKRRHGRDAYASRMKSDRRRSGGDGEWAAGF
ncbi:mitochondrial import receptor subunit TOM20 [Belnapia moabensis]|jgi:hypothetical protein|uniref:hypothetical protein n=1 Tax=Belnapia moabensis TaxID=365533 RepID=UPI0012ECE86C|nr:hypothetical protein [Belnapia moabensis]